MKSPDHKNSRNGSQEGVQQRLDDSAKVPVQKPLIDRLFPEPESGADRQMFSAGTGGSLPIIVDSAHLDSETIQRINRSCNRDGIAENDVSSAPVRVEQGGGRPGPESYLAAEHAEDLVIGGVVLTAALRRHGIDMARHTMGQGESNHFADSPDTRIPNLNRLLGAAVARSIGEYAPVRASGPSFTEITIRWLEV